MLGILMRFFFFIGCSMLCPTLLFEFLNSHPLLYKENRVGCARIFYLFLPINSQYVILIFFSFLTVSRTDLLPLFPSLKPYTGVLFLILSLFSGVIFCPLWLSFIALLVFSPLILCPHSLSLLHTLWKQTIPVLFFLDSSLYPCSSTETILSKVFQCFTQLLFSVAFKLLTICSSLNICLSLNPLVSYTLASPPIFNLAVFFLLSQIH